MEKAASQSLSRPPKRVNLWCSSSMSLFYRVLGVVILGYMIIVYKTQDLAIHLIAFFISAIAIISWILLARRGSIR